jgi:hypothetical protein
MRKLIAIITLTVLPVPAHSFCAVDDTSCKAAERSARALEDANRQMQWELQRQRLENLSRADQSAPPPLPPPSDCNNINPLSSFSRGYRSGGLFGAFGNLEEEQQRCREAAKSPTAPPGVTAPAPQQSPENDPLAQPQTQKIIADLQQQARHDPELPKKACEYQRSLLAAGRADVHYLWACIYEGHLQISK